MNKKKELLPEIAKENAALKEIFNSKKKELGLTQGKLAERFNMTQPAIGHYLNGLNALNPDIAGKFA